MLYYIRSGKLSACKHANCPKRAAMDLLKDRESEFGEFVIVGTDKITEESDHDKIFAFSTDALLLENNRGMRLVV